ncbi:competence protein ComK [Niallia sp. 03133]|uniref:competence protein ComK n=1 Tax=Niallia sp. 03133 TaxID=3458060 RepID=UPI0040440CF5
MKDRKNFITRYEINFYTLAIEPFITKEGKIYSKIYEGPNVFFCSSSPTKIVENSCMYLGCSYKGKRDAVRALMNYTYKLPISIDSLNTLYFFPTHSPTNSSCVWISLHHIIDKKEITPLKSRITFKNQKQLSVDISPHSLNNQIMRANSLQNVLTYNHKKIQKPFFLYENDYKDFKKCGEDNIDYDHDEED